MKAPRKTSHEKATAHAERHGGLVERLGTLYMKALDQGYDLVQLSRKNGYARLRLGYVDDVPGRAALIVIAEARLQGPHALRYLNKLLEEVGGNATPELPTVPDDTAIGSTIGLAHAFLFAYTAGQLAEKLKPQLLTRMLSEGRAAVDVPGMGAVTYVPGTIRRTIDEEAVTRLLDVPVPRKESPVAATLRVTPAPPAAPPRA